MVTVRRGWGVSLAVGVAAFINRATTPTGPECLDDARSDFLLPVARAAALARSRRSWRRWTKLTTWTSPHAMSPERLRWESGYISPLTELAHSPTETSRFRAKSSGADGNSYAEASTRATSGMTS